jgi:hypothetical protein
MERMPALRCISTVSLMASSSTARSSSCVHFFASKSARFLRSASGRLSEPMWSARNGGFRRGAADIVVEGRKGFSVIAIGEPLYSHRQFELPGTVCHRSCACESPSVSSQIAERTKERACCSPTLFVPAFILITYELAL